MIPTERTYLPATELHVWQARLGEDGWPAADRLPDAERERAAAMLRAQARSHWVAARWALRGVLARYLAREPAEIELRLGTHGKPRLARGGFLRFNLSHSGGLALVAVAGGRDVGVDVERIGARPAEFYADWARREATVKCLGTGLGVPPPNDPVVLLDLDAAPGFAAAVAISGNAARRLRSFTIEALEVEPYEPVLRGEAGHRSGRRRRARRASA